jgi:hypothetical protein
MDNEAVTSGELLWTPSAEAVQGSRMAHFMFWLNTRRAERKLPPLEDYAALWRFSVQEL